MNFIKWIQVIMGIAIFIVTTILTGRGKLTPLVYGTVITALITYLGAMTFYYKRKTK